MKKIIIMLAISLMAICNTVYAEDRLTISDFLISPGETKEVSITLENSASYVAFQFDLYLPVGLTIEAYNADENRIPESTMLSMARQSDGAYRFISVATNAEPIVGNAGSIVKLTVKATDNVAPVVGTGYFRKVKLAKNDATGAVYAEMSFPVSIVAPVVITAKSYTRKYGEENPTFEYTTEGATLEGVPEISCEATATSPVGTYDIIVKQGTVTNYNVVYVKGTLTITKADASITTIPKAKTLTYTGEAQTLVETGTATGGTMQYSLNGETYSAEVPTGVNAGDYTVYYRVIGDTNHSDVAAQTIAVTITKASLTITAGTYTKKQGEAMPEFTLSYEGFKNNETKDVLTKLPTVSCEATVASAPGEYPVTVSGAEAQNYNINYTNGKLVVTAADPVTITAKSYTREYGETNPAFEFTTEGATLEGVPEITCEATATSPVGTYDIIVSKGTVANYNVTYVAGTLTITKAPLTIAAGTYTKKQGEAMPEFTLSYEGFKNNETKDVLTKQPTVSCDATVDSAPGEYPVTISGAEAQNYNINYTNGKLIVTAADPVTITAKSYTREYGNANPTFEFTTEGAELEGTPEITCEATATSPVGTYDIIVSKGTVANYNVTYVAGTLTITKAPLTIAAGTYTKKQGEAMPEFTLSYEGFKNNETKDVLTKQPTVSCNATVASAPGEYPVTISGAEAQNYSISYTNGKLVVTVADPVTITAKSYTREYGNANPTFEFTTEGAELEGTPEITCEATATSPVGTYDIIVTKGTVANYNVTYVAGTLTITKTPLTIAAGIYTKKQGEAMPEFTLSYEGFKNNETKDVLTKLPTVSCEATVASAPGEYPVTVSGAEAQNYDISYTNGKLIVTEADLITIKAKSYTREYGEINPTFEFTTEGATLEGTPEITCEATATSPVGTYDIIVSKGTVANYNVTYVAGTLTITKAPLTIAAGTYTKKQGEAMPEFTLSYEGFKNNETKDVLTKQPTVSCDATVDSAPGEYPVTISGAEAQNYNINYTNGKLIVTEADLITIKAKSYTREYGETNPTFEFTTEGATLEGVPEISCEATATSPVGTYDIIVKQGTVTNYNVTYAKGTLTITKAPLTASVGNYSREYKQKDPEFVINYSGWKNGDDESVLITKPVAATTATKESPIGEYPIIVSGGEAQNYEFNYVNGVLTVTKTTDISDAPITNKKKDSKTIYDLQGRKVTNMKKGLYIVGGRKVVK